MSLRLLLWPQLCLGYLNSFFKHSPQCQDILHLQSFTKFSICTGELSFVKSYLHAKHCFMNPARYCCFPRQWDMGHSNSPAPQEVPETQALSLERGRCYLHRSWRNRGNILLSRPRIYKLVQVAVGTAGARSLLKTCPEPSNRNTRQKAGKRGKK